ncbi:peptide chain release factor PrfB3, chloroplastic isoform X2 [Solanum dulcamara]|uniref:peptide chain release factor PrfB3, chloroplastic isoform X2 n=1 Tax=Solanum dulcamara TaxID=45834 RepID=UPI0024859085|nr:peptide chain release factor PrfB3, chloroplastic isoform X2 [Solanum dulcamara]
MAKLAGDPFSVRTEATCSSSPWTLRRSKTAAFRIRAHNNQHIDDKNRFYKELGTFALKRKIEDLVLRAEMLAPTALEFEEARHLKQEEIIRECDLWDDVAKSNEDLVQLAESAKAVDALKDLRYKAEEAKLITEMAGMDSINYDFLKQAYTACVNVNKTLDKYEMSKLLREPYDMEGACVTIESGNEGIYSKIWAEKLTRMYIKWAKKQGHKSRIAEKHDSESGGIKYVMIELEFKSAYGYLSGERGIHCMSGSSEGKFDLSKDGAAAIDVIPLFLESSPDLQIDENDLEITTTPSYEEEQGRTSPSITIQHIPTGLQVRSTGERSPFANKLKALNRLKAKLLIVMREQGVLNLASIRNSDISSSWNQVIRRYVFHPNKLVEDMKTGVQLSDLTSVLNGNIEPFIGAHINSRRHEIP